MNRDPWDDKEVREWLRRCEEEMLPKMRDSALALSHFDGKIDAKLCVEIGAAVLYDRPIVIIADAGESVPKNLEKCAHTIVRGNPDDPRVRGELQKAIEEIAGKRGKRT